MCVSHLSDIADEGAGEQVRVAHLHTGAEEGEGKYRHGYAPHLQGRRRGGERGRERRGGERRGRRGRGEGEERKGRREGDEIIGRGGERADKRRTRRG